MDKTDFVGKPLIALDKVVLSYGKQLTSGKIEYFTEKKVAIKLEDGSEIYRYPNELLKRLE